jgi:hypothetical protein
MARKIAAKRKSKSSGKPKPPLKHSRRNRATRARTPSRGTNADNPTPIRVFISYKREDQAIADAVKKALETIGGDNPLNPAVRGKIKCFFDQDINHGEDWKRRIDQELKRSNWFILVYTGNDKNYEMCTWEASRFEVMHDAQLQKRQSEIRICCLHDTPTNDVPQIMKPYQMAHVFPPDSEEGKNLRRRENLRDGDAYAFLRATPSGVFLRRFIESCHGTVPLGAVDAIQEAVATRAQMIIDAFRNASDPKAGERIIHPRIWLEFTRETIEALKLENVTELPKNTRVSADGDSIAFEFFGMSKAETTWGEIEQRFILAFGHTQVGWIEEAEQAILSAIRGDALVPIEQCFSELGKAEKAQVIRPVLTRQKIFRSGRQKFYLLFVRARDRRLIGNEVVSYQLALLLMSCRFRYEVLKGQWTFGYAQLGPVAFTQQATRFIRLIEKAEYEAMEFGARDNLIQQAFNNVGDRELLRQMGDDWYCDKAKLIRTISDPNETVESKRDTIQSFITAWLPRNHAFLMLVGERLLTRMQEEEPPTPRLTAGNQLIVAAPENPPSVAANRT